MNNDYKWQIYKKRTFIAFNINWKWKRKNLIFILYTLFLFILLPINVCKSECLTGKFTDVQKWAFRNGSLTNRINSSHALDLSGKPNVSTELRLLMSVDVRKEISYRSVEDSSKKLFNITKNYHIFLDKIKNKRSVKNIYFLSLAQNSLDRIPLYYTDGITINGSNWKHLKYLSLYGNNFQSDPIRYPQNLIQYSITINATSWEEIYSRHNVSNNKGILNWAIDIAKLDLHDLLELDLRNCSIEVIYEYTFRNLSSLRRLYLAENKIYEIHSFGFAGLSKLVHLDISKNTVEINNNSKLIEGMFLYKDIFTSLINLKSLDLSHSRIIQTHSIIFKEIGNTVERLSLCYTHLPPIIKGMFVNTSVKYLDISGNVGSEQMDKDAFSGLENTLEILYANQLNIKELNSFLNLFNLKVLTLSKNDISSLKSLNLENMTTLKILDLSNNRISNWNENTFSHIEDLEILMLNDNNLNLLSHRMLEDFNKTKFLSLGSNSFVCNCFMKIFIDGVCEDNISEINNTVYPEWYVNKTVEEEFKYPSTDNKYIYISLSENISYHNAYNYYSEIIHNRNKKMNKYSKYKNQEMCNDNNYLFHLLDFNEKKYLCRDSNSNTLMNFTDIQECKKTNEPLPSTMSKFMLIVVSVIMLLFIILIVIIIVWKWWYIRYFFLMMKNIAVLSITRKENIINENEKEFAYDVFVSYCEEDRIWVLDEFLPQIEDQSSISVCLHERDFQVGLSILENIISCMDRSRALLLVISSQFLLSHWCQFEMHLAQHRLLETRREQLILVLLEDIPRRKRPNTLHYLMMTKTYIVWPLKVEEKIRFWKRLKKAILYGKPNNYLK